MFLLLYEFKTFDIVYVKITTHEKNYNGFKNLFNKLLNILALRLFYLHQITKLRHL